jgi:hypothetical protein
LKADPGPLGLDTPLKEIGQLAPASGKRGIFTRMVNAALERPDDTVRAALFPAAPGGEKTLRQLTKELMASEDQRGLSPLFWPHINPYGRFHLDMDKHLDLSGVA